VALEDAHGASRPADAGEPWLVVDGYHFDDDYLTGLRGAAARMAMFADDGRAPFADLDVLLNQNLGAEQCAYRTSPRTTRLLGTQYVSIRREFLAWRGLRRDTPAVARRLLVTLGGSDPANVTPIVIQALRSVSVPDLEIRVVVGPANPRLRQVRQRTAEGFELVTDPTRMPEQLAWADLAITAAGSTCWEMCCLALPQCVIAVNDTQAAVASALDRAGAAVFLGRATDLDAASIAGAIKPLLPDPARRARLGECGRALIDGDGAQRVVRALLSVSVPGLSADTRSRPNIRPRERRHAAA
jgi:spore coat polysaccharide biosynthesis predicted glycosyltransferase SpsG